MVLIKLKISSYKGIVQRSLTGVLTDARGTTPIREIGAPLQLQTENWQPATNPKETLKITGKLSSSMSL
jgi:hypothetical protein